VGHLVGLSVGMAMLLGLVISWGAAVPYYTVVAHLTGAPSSEAVGAGVAYVFKHNVRYVGAGAIGFAAIWTLLKLIVPVWGGLTSAMRASKARGAGDILPRTEQDMPIGLVGLISLASLVPISVLLAGFLKGGALVAFTLPLVAAALVYIVVIGLLVAAVVGYMAGLIGSSNSPLSGIGILAVVGVASLLALWVKPLVGDAASLTLTAFALFVTAVVFTVGTIANDNLQDLKTGQLVDATPWKQQAALIFGVFAGALSIPPVLWLLGQVYGFAGMAHAGPNALPAPQANLIADLAQGIISGKLQQNEMIVGLVLGGGLVILDEVLRMLKLLRLPPLAVGLGIYLPMSSTLFVVVGAICGHLYEGLVEKTRSGAVAKRLGVLLASGLIVGESLFGVVNAGVVALAQTGLLPWIKKGDPHADAPLAPDFFAKIVDSDLILWVTLGVFAAVAGGLYLWTRNQAKSTQG
jgi:putative OPT family oligopeptide transporter